MTNQQQPGALEPSGAKSGFLTMMLAVGGPIFLLFGLHRLYTGHIGVGLGQLFTLGGCGIWQLIDIVSIVTRKYTDKNGAQLLRDHPLRKLAK
jgi:hypothetical protein